MEAPTPAGEAAATVVAIELWLWVGRVASRPTLAERDDAQVTQGV